MAAVPTPDMRRIGLIGYGAAPILGYGLALALARKAPQTPSG